MISPIAFLLSSSMAFVSTNLVPRKAVELLHVGHARSLFTSLRFSLAMGRRICQVWSGDANATLAKIPYRPWVGGSSIASKPNDNGERFLRFLVAADLVATNTFQRTSASPKVLGTFFGNKHPTQIDFQLISRRSTHAVWTWARTEHTLTVRRPGTKADHRPLLSQMFCTAQLPSPELGPTQTVSFSRCRFDHDRLRALLDADRQREIMKKDGSFGVEDPQLRQARRLLSLLLDKLDMPQLRSVHESAAAWEYTVCQVTKQIFGSTPVNAKKPWITSATWAIMDEAQDTVRARDQLRYVNVATLDDLRQPWEDPDLRREDAFFSLIDEFSGDSLDEDDLLSACSEFSFLSFDSDNDITGEPFSASYPSVAPPEVLPSSARALQWSLTGASQRAKGLGPPVDDLSRHTLQQELLSLLSTETADSVTQEFPSTNPFRKFGWDYLQGRKRIIRRHRLADWSPQQLFGSFRTQLSQWFQSTRFRGIFRPVHQLHRRHLNLNLGRWSI